MNTLRIRLVPPPHNPAACDACAVRPASICAVLEDEGLERLAAVSVLVPEGHEFITESEPAEAFFVITSGTAKLFKMLADGRRQITGFAQAGGFVGLAVQETYGFSAEAVEETYLCRVSRGRLRRLVNTFPAVKQYLLQQAASELVAAQEQMLLLGRKTAHERLASFLLALAGRGRLHEPPPAGTEVRLAMARDDVADYLGLTVETVSRTLKSLRLAGYVTMPLPSLIVLVDPGALRRLAAGQG